MFEKRKDERKTKSLILESYNKKIKELIDSDAEPEEIQKIVAMKRDVKINGIQTGDIMKVVGNVAVVGIIVGFEMTHIINQKASRFIKVL